MYFLNQIFIGLAMTCAQRKKELDELKCALGGNHARDSSDNLDLDDVCNSDPNLQFPSNDTLDFSNNYLCEGSHDKMMMDSLIELNINDIRDFLKDMDPDNPKPFGKTYAPHHHNIT